MKQNVRRGWRKLLFVSVMIFAAFTLTAKDAFSADYIPDPVLVGTVDVVPPVTKEVIVDLTATPKSGFVPLSVAFSCTAEAEVHYADEIWAQPPQGSVEETKPLYKKVPVPAEDIKIPVLDEPIRELGIYTFTATAVHGGVTGEGSVTVTVKPCKASNKTVTTSISYGIDLAKDKMQNIITAAPMITSASLSASGNFSKKTSEKCCNLASSPVEVKEYSGAASIKGNVTFNIPGWSWKFVAIDHQKKLYKVKIDITAGPELSLSPSGTLGISGTDDPCGSSSVQIAGSMAMKVELSFGAHADCEYAVWKSGGQWRWEGKVEVKAEVSASTDAGASVTYPLPNGPGSGKFYSGDLDGTAIASFTLGSWDFSKSASVTILKGT
ncbi:hypothetical protein KKH42_05395 [bacterium]|nr:hypothetical protein [bacterium]MBU4134739.1 hypothetical protein [bacterium]